MSRSKWQEPSEDVARILAAFSLGSQEGRKEGIESERFERGIAIGEARSVGRKAGRAAALDEAVAGIRAVCPAFESHHEGFVCPTCGVFERAVRGVPVERPGALA